MAKKPTLEVVDASLARWKTRLKRAIKAIDKLEKQRKRLVKRPVEVIAHKDVTLQDAIRATVDRAGELIEAVGRGDDKAIQAYDKGLQAYDNLAIPTFLKRTPDPVADQIREEQAATKKAKAAGRIAKMKAKKAGDLKKMPLSGKAALDAIKNG